MNFKMISSFNIKRLLSVLIALNAGFCVAQTNSNSKTTQEHPVYNRMDFAKSKLSKVPKVGIHPRVLFSPSDIPDIQNRLKNTEVGKAVNAYMLAELSQTTRNPKVPIGQAVIALSKQDFESFKRLEASFLIDNPAFTDKVFRNSIIAMLRVDALECLLSNNQERGKIVAAAIASWAKNLEPEVEIWRKSLYPNDASRWGSWHALGSYALFATHHLGDAYDVAFNFMSTEQRTQTRRVIAKITNGAYTFANRLPAHLRSWNWVNYSNCLPTLALAIEGEEGYDAKVYQAGVEIMRDYINANYSLKGSSTESLGYTSGGWKDGVPAVLAMARRGDNLMLMPKYQAIKNWQLHVMLPQEGEWLNHGDLGNYPPGFHEIQLMKYFYPSNAIIDYNYQQVTKKMLAKPTEIKEMLFEAVILACDVSKTTNGKWIDYQQGKALQQTLDFFDEERGNLVSRNSWDKNAVQLNFECRPDTYYAGHEHADRGNFNIAALGRLWTPEGMRSPEGKYHNIITIDGRGQGYFPTPGKWLGYYQSADAVFGSCDTKYAYDWFWPKSIVSVDTNSTKFKSPRFALYRAEAVDYQQKYVMERDPHPNVKNKFSGVDFGDSGMWDEDPWPVRIAYNPVQYAYRTAGLVRGKHPYVVVFDDIKKDNQEHLYEWNMMLAADLEIVSIKEEDAAQNFLGPRVLERTNNFYTDIILGSELIPNKEGVYQPAKGEPLLLVRVLQKNNPADIRNYDIRPNPRLEVIEKKDTFSSPGVHLGPGGRTFGTAKRLVIPSRAASPDFKVMIYPFRYGIDPLPQTNFSDTAQLKIKIGEEQDIYQLKKDSTTGKTSFVLQKSGSNSSLKVD